MLVFVTLDLVKLFQFWFGLVTKIRNYELDFARYFVLID